jgi:hypothetical protein
MKLTRGREMHIKMKKETWWGKEENRHAGSIKPDDDISDGTGGLLTRQRLSTSSARLASRATMRCLTAKSKRSLFATTYIENHSLNFLCTVHSERIQLSGLSDYRTRGLEPITPIFPGRV